MAVNKESGEALTEQYNNLRLFIGDVLFKGSSSYRLTKSELDRVLLEGTGLLLSQDVLDAIFNKIHAEGRGTISKDDLFDYIRGLGPSTNTKAKQVNYVVYHMLTSAAWWMTIFYNVACGSAATINVLKRVGWHSGFNFRLLHSTLFGVGTFAFVVFSFLSHKAIFELNEEMKRGLKKLVVEQGIDTIPDGSGGISSSDLGLLLERNSILVSSRSLNDVFREIDQDGDGRLTMSDIKDFLESNPKEYIDLSEFNRMLLVVNTMCVKSIAFWSSWFWFLGSVLFIAANSIEWSETARQQLAAWGAIMYSFGGLFLLHVAVMGVYMHEAYIRELQVFFEIVSENFDSRDAKLTVNELYFAIMKDSGVNVPYEYFVSMFKEADTENMGRLSVQEFVTSFDKIGSKSSFRWNVIKKVPRKAVFWSSMSYAFGGVLLVVAAYGVPVGLSALTISNLYLVSALLYTIPTMRTSFIVIPTNLLMHFSHMEHSQITFQSRILLLADDYACEFTLEAQLSDRHDATLRDNALFDDR
jgi:Ca2+-binding EF-hand superfamily protein